MRKNLRNSFGFLLASLTTMSVTACQIKEKNHENQSENNSSTPGQTNTMLDKDSSADSETITTETNQQDEKSNTNQGKTSSTISNEEKLSFNFEWDFQFQYDYQQNSAKDNKLYYMSTDEENSYQQSTLSKNSESSIGSFMEIDSILKNDISYNLTIPDQTFPYYANTFYYELDHNQQLIDTVINEIKQQKNLTVSWLNDFILKNNQEPSNMIFTGDKCQVKIITLGHTICGTLSFNLNIT